MKKLDALKRAAANMDWQQVVLNGGPPCFHLEDGRFCGRAARWAGHGDDGAKDHAFIPFATLLRTVEELARKAAQ